MAGLGWAVAGLSVDVFDLEVTPEVAEGVTAPLTAGGFGLVMAVFVVVVALGARLD